MREFFEIIAPFVPITSVVPWAVAFLLWRAWEQERKECREDRDKLAAFITNEREQRVIVLQRVAEVEEDDFHRGFLGAVEGSGRGFRPGASA